MAEQGNVYADMVGDLFHPGHVALLRAARDFGERLIVGVLSDEVVATYKRRPIMTLAERVAVIEACRYVDEVLPNAPSSGGVARGILHQGARRPHKRATRSLSGLRRPPRTAITPFAAARHGRVRRSVPDLPCLVSN
ncbi:adenylyltransferase/cytidyltransferase family protein [Streptomyces sp. NPDC004732]|uniref:adenylyltransferase/cytidyltransferase family protein n=1 Tax=Streptomyces sp. NPDC004732 TaxID=3154290 RepID=UPI0033AA51C8